MFVFYKFLTFLYYLCFEVKQPNFDISTELPFSGDLKNPGQLPVHSVLMILSYGFLKFLFYMFSMSRNPLLILLMTYLVWVTSKI